jgi:hypothetical protein
VARRSEDVQVAAANLEGEEQVDPFQGDCAVDVDGCVNGNWIWPTFRDRLGPGVSRGQVTALS